MVYYPIVSNIVSILSGQCCIIYYYPANVGYSNYIQRMVETRCKALKLLYEIYHNDIYIDYNMKAINPVKCSSNSIDKIGYFGTYSAIETMQITYCHNPPTDSIPPYTQELYDYTCRANQILEIRYSLASLASQLFS